MQEISRRPESAVERQDLYRQLQMERVARDSRIVAYAEEDGISRMRRVYYIGQAGKVAAEQLTELDELVDEKAKDKPAREFMLRRIEAVAAQAMEREIAR